MKANNRKQPPGQQTISVMVADGPLLSSSTLVMFLDNADDIDVVALAENKDEAVRRAKGHKPDVIVYDPPLLCSVEECEEAIKEMKEASPRSHVLVISEREGGDFARQLINAGAIAYLLKEDEPQALIDAIRRGKEGKPSVSARIAMAIAVSSDPQEETLTVREEEILKLIALGHTNAEVGELLHLSVRTVESHRANIMSKMGFGSRAELVSHALENEILKSG